MLAGQKVKTRKDTQYAWKDKSRSTVCIETFVSLKFRNAMTFIYLTSPAPFRIPNESDGDTRVQSACAMVLAGTIPYPRPPDLQGAR